jgi:hypothetical protein
VTKKKQWKRVLSIASPYLEPGESVRRFESAQTFNPLWTFSYLPLVMIEPFHRSWFPFIFGIAIIAIIAIIVLGRTVWKKKVGRIVVITDRRVLVWATNGQRNAPQPEFLRELPRGTMIGSASGNFWRSFNTLGERLYLPLPFGRGGEERLGART